MMFEVVIHVGPEEFEERIRDDGARVRLLIAGGHVVVFRHGTKNGGNIQAAQHWRHNEQKVPLPA